ncbi:MAG: hypothetical protein KDA33_07475 [Phycisphaerales bacterium]|nr:hypothetical protein [Phycisphaerales bacterium]
MIGTFVSELIGYGLIFIVVLWFVDIWAFAIGAAIAAAIIAAIFALSWRTVTAPIQIVVGAKELRLRRSGADSERVNWNDVREINFRAPWLGVKSLILRLQDGRKRVIKLPGRDVNAIYDTIDAIRRRAGAN